MHMPCTCHAHDMHIACLMLHASGEGWEDITYREFHKRYKVVNESHIRKVDYEEDSWWKCTIGYEEHQSRRKPSKYVIPHRGNNGKGQHVSMPVDYR